MAATLKDISRLTGVNTCSISQVLNGHPKAQTLRPETRKKILEAAKTLGYSKNQMAAAMAGRHGKVLAFVHSDMGSAEYTGRIQYGVIEAANKRGYTITIHHIGKSPEALFRELLGWRAAGVIFHIEKLEVIREISAMLAREGIPFGTVNLSNPEGIGVTTDDASGIREAVRCLAETGHRKIAFAFFRGTGGNAPAEFHTRRIRGFESGLRECFPGTRRKPLFVPVDFNGIGSREYMNGILRDLKKKNVEGIVCESDILASVLNNAALFCGYRVPEDFSLIGFGGSLVSRTALPAISTVMQDFEKMGALSTDFVLDSIEHKVKGKVRNEMIPVRLLMRDSVMKRQR